jgi:transcriptional regulator with XRE-family HTH domain
MNHKSEFRIRQAEIPPGFKFGITLFSMRRDSEVIDLLRREWERLRKEGVQQKAIAERADLPTATVSRILSGRSPDASFSRVASLALAMGLSLDALARGDDAPSTLTPYEKNERVRSLVDLLTGGVEEVQRDRIFDALELLVSAIVKGNVPARPSVSEKAAPRGAAPTYPQRTTRPNDPSSPSSSSGRDDRPAPLHPGPPKGGRRL